MREIDSTDPEITLQKPKWFYGRFSRVFGNNLLRGSLTAVVATLVASAMGVYLEEWANFHNQQLLYVLAVVFVGLRHGAWSALIAAALIYPNVSYFLADPVFSFAVDDADELTTLLLMSTIALVSGQAASRIRDQFLQLQEANRSSRALVTLGHRLLSANDIHTVWQALLEELSQAISVECRLAIRRGEGHWNIEPGSKELMSRQVGETLDRILCNPSSPGPVRPTLINLANQEPWMVYPIAEDRVPQTCILVCHSLLADGLKPGDHELISIMTQHSAETWRRIDIAKDLDNATRLNDREQLRSALLSSVSHDLKSPLSAMMGSAESLLLLENQLSTADRHELLSTILQESRRLESYIQNLLDMTRLEHGELSIDRDWVPIDDLIGSALDRLQRYHPDALLDYHSSCHDLLLWVNSDLLEQALFNVLENAVKFSPPDVPIVVKTSVENLRCIVEIIDQGPGIPEASLEAVFDMFYVVSGGDNGQSGTGMGLAISRGMLSSQGAFVRAEHGPDGRGTRMVVELPLDRGELLLSGESLLSKESLSSGDTLLNGDNLLSGNNLLSRESNP